MNKVRQALDTALRALALAMAVAAIVLSILDASYVKAAIILLSIGLVAIVLAALAGIKD